jgi:hypothetical protein
MKPRRLLCNSFLASFDRPAIVSLVAASFRPLASALALRLLVCACNRVTASFRRRSLIASWNTSTAFSTLRRCVCAECTAALLVSTDAAFLRACVRTQALRRRACACSLVAAFW